MIESPGVQGGSTGRALTNVRARSLRRRSPQKAQQCRASNGSLRLCLKSKEKGTTDPTPSVRGHPSRVPIRRLPDSPDSPDFFGVSDFGVFDFGVFAALRPPR